MYEGMLAETVTITGHDGDDINAYSARPLGPGPFPGVVVIHHAPGWDEATAEITRRFAHHGYVAICPNLHYREAPRSSPDDAASAVRAKGGVPNERLIGDVSGAMHALRAAPASNGKVACIGYCSGGRQSFLAATALPVDAAVVCYGAFIVGSPPGAPASMTPIIDRARDLRCPVLGLFGAEDQHPSPEEVSQIDAKLTRLGKPHEFHTFANAGHGFFATDKEMYRVVAANEGWKLIFEFFGRTLAATT
ncbi:MAG: dienelactone hydrolase family protein [Candidatus Dormibacteraeota bacterium]|nr:dienelactone hydrolase family protein [Candidatus Dormibacteraeota bacterium]